MSLHSSLLSRQALRRGHSALQILDGLIERHGSLVMGIILLVYLGRAYFISRATAMTPDELLTYSEAQLPSLHALWSTLKNFPVVADPPLHPFLTFFTFRLPLQFPLSLRLPAIVAYGALILSLFVFVRKRAPASVALIASAVPILIPMFLYAVQARPYALVLGFSGWAFVFWQSVAERRTKRAAALIGLYLCLTCALLSHYLGGLVFAPLVAGELWRSFRHRVDAAVWTVFAAAALTVFAYIPLLPATRSYGVHPWHGVFTSDLTETYLLAISPVILVALSLCALLWLARPQTGHNSPAMQFPKHETIAMVAFYCVPVVAFGFGKVLAHSYVPRYALMFSIAASIVTGVLIYALTCHVRGLASAILVILVAYSVLPILKGLAHQSAQNTEGIGTSRLSILDRFPGLPIAVTNFDDYGRLHLFGPDQLKRRLMLIFDASAITEYGTGVGVATERMRRALNAPSEPYKEFLRSRSRFLLLGAYWLRGKLLHDGWKIAFVGTIDRWDLYEVTKPSFIREK